VLSDGSGELPVISAAIAIGSLSWNAGAGRIDSCFLDRERAGVHFF